MAQFFIILIQHSLFIMVACGTPVKIGMATLAVLFVQIELLRLVIPAFVHALAITAFSQHFFLWTGVIVLNVTTRRSRAGSMRRIQK